MSKYEEILNKQIKYAEFTENPVVCLDIEVAKGLLITKTKSPTIEEVKREWEEKGYSWIETRDEILLMSKKKQIFIDKRDKMYSCSGHSTNLITFQEHQLITKTMKALGWM